MGVIMKKRFLDIIILFLAVIWVCILISEPEVCKNGTAEGILLCGKVIIPSLFPFTMCVIFIINSGVLNSLELIFPRLVSRKKLRFDIFFIILLSFIGGYPIGAKLLNNTVTENRLTKVEASNMLNHSVNAGPAFVISAVGSGILNSKKIGIILLCSHIFSGIMLILFAPKSNTHTKTILSYKHQSINLADNFVKSVAEASNTVLNICSFTILFSAINEYINFFAENIKPVKIIGLILEITNAVTLTNNIYLISFLLGFGGISVWCQVLSVGSNLEIRPFKFILFRILHGVLSICFTAVLLRLFPVNISVFSTTDKLSFSYFYSSGAVGISLLTMAIVFIISLSTKKYAGKIIEDMI